MYSKVRSLGALIVAAAVMWAMGAPVTAISGEDADQARITGVVRDQLNAVSLPGVTVEAFSGADVVEVTHTDVDGRYVLLLPPGDYQLKVSMEGYETRTVNVAATTEKPIAVDVGIPMAKFAEEVTVTADLTDANTSTESAQLLIRKNAGVITDNLGAASMRANADSNAAGAMARVTGLSVIGGQYVFVRGLGERYSNTTLGGAVIPTTEPEKKVVPLDMFPSAVLDSVQIAKSYSPDKSAEFAGGLVEIVPIRFPGQTTLDVSYGIGWNTQTAGKDGFGYPGGGRDWLGFDDGTRELPAGFPTRKVVRGGIFTPDVGFLRPELEPIGESFANVWERRPRTGKPNQNGSFVFGGRFGDVALVGSYTQSYREQRGDERQIYYRTQEETGELSTFSDYDYVYDEARANIAAVGSIAYQFSPSHRITLQNFYTHTGRDDTRSFVGFNSDINTDIVNERLYWSEEGLVSTAASGEHFLQGGTSLKLDWRASYSRADRDEPDLRETLYERNGDIFVLADESQSGFRMFNTLEDDTVDVTAGLSIFSRVRGLPVQYKFGGQYVDRTRDFASRRFRFVPTNIVGLDLSQRPEELFTPANIGPRFELREETRPTDFYDAQQTVAGAYGMVDWALSSRARFVAGARVEDFDQEVNTFDLFSLAIDPRPSTSTNQETDVFPAVNLVFAVRPDQNLRFSVSQTTNRPEFRELAEFEFTDIVGGRAVVGNPALKRALIQNYDVRWEFFPGAEQVIAASFFYKNFDDPIERIIRPTAQLQTSFTNADSARNVGIELEARKRITEAFLVGANYAFVDSEITLSPAASEVQTSLSRPLEGQSKNLFNFLFEARHDQTYGRVLVNHFGDRISDVGALGLPDIIEQGRTTLDLIVGTQWNRLGIRFSLENVLDDPYEFTQGGQLQRRFELGRTAMFSFGFSAF
jgi:outer membrane receptor protein involved in Fe transport